MVLQCDQEPAGQRLRTRNTVRSDHRASELQENAAHSETGRVLVHGSSHPVTHREPESKSEHVPATMAGAGNDSDTT